MESPFLATIRKPLFTLHLFDCCISSVKKYRLGTSKCHDHDIFTLHQPIRLQHFERGNEKHVSVCSHVGSSLPPWQPRFHVTLAACRDPRVISSFQ